MLIFRPFPQKEEKYTKDDYKSKLRDSQSRTADG